MKNKAYILFETMAALTVLSIGMIAINEAIRQAIITRGQAEDYTTARFLMEKVTSDKEVELELIEGEEKGQFPEPYERFSFEWKISKAEVPPPPIPQNVPPHMMRMLKEGMDQMRYIGKLTVKIGWSRAGQPFSAAGETLLRPGQLWLPTEEAMP